MIHMTVEDVLPIGLVGYVNKKLLAVVTRYCIEKVDSSHVGQPWGLGPKGRVRIAHET